MLETIGAARGEPRRPGRGQRDFGGAGCWWGAEGPMLTAGTDPPREPWSELSGAAANYFFL